MAKKKLLHIQLLPLLSGVQNMMLELLSHLDREEYEIFVLSKPGGPLVEAVKTAGYHYLPMPSLRRNISPWDFVAFWEIYLLVRKYRFDIVHTHSSKTGFLGRIAARLGGVRKVVHTVHGFAIHEQQPGFNNLVYIFLERLASQFCDRIIFVNNFERKFALKKHIVTAQKSCTIYNTVNPDKFNSGQRNYANRNYVEQPFTIGSVLRFTTQKNMINTVRAAIKVCKQREQVRFIFIGDGEQYLMCKQLVEHENLNTRILLTGWQQEIELLLPKFDVFLLYSRWEGLPISILEAMACSLPVVCSDIKGNNELVDAENGILIPINKEEELVKELVKLPERRADLQKWSLGSRRKVEEKFGSERFVNEYREVYEH
ncbi:MAG: glycosyltransferase family 4 protein [Candidatus Cloacimonetes bacterium]|nr:glycosyltransferase family 4 protein [Candidatus Cloacimonadota bacterium]